MTKKVPYQFTPIPTYTLDFIFPTLNGGDTKVLSFIIRQTLGWGKLWDHISLSQFEYGITRNGSGKMVTLGTGLARNSIKRALRSLVEQDLITIEVWCPNQDCDYIADVWSSMPKVCPRCRAKMRGNRKVVCEIGFTPEQWCHVTGETEMPADVYEDEPDGFQIPITEIGRAHV